MSLHKEDLDLAEIIEAESLVERRNVFHIAARWETNLHSLVCHYVICTYV